MRPEWETRKPTAGDVLDHARNDPIVATVVEHWKRGVFNSWEEAMTALVCYLSHDRQRLLKMATDMKMSSHRKELREARRKTDGDTATTDA